MNQTISNKLENIKKEILSFAKQIETKFTFPENIINDGTCLNDYLVFGKHSATTNDSLAQNILFFGTGEMDKYDVEIDFESKVDEFGNYAINFNNFSNGRAAENVKKLSDKISKSWHEFQSVMNEKVKVKKVKEPFKKRVVTRGKRALKKTAVRKVSRHIVNNSQAIVTNALCQALGSDPASYEKIAAFVSSDIGKGVVAGLLSVGLDVLPLPIGGEVGEELKEAVIEELQTQAFDHASQPLENAAALLVPMLTQAFGQYALLAASNKEIKQLK